MNKKYINLGVCSLLAGAIITIFTGLVGSYTWSQATSLTTYGQTANTNCDYDVINAKQIEPPVSCTPVSYGRPLPYLSGRIYTLSAQTIEQGMPVSSYNFYASATYNAAKLVADWIFWSVLSCGVIVIAYNVYNAYKPKKKPVKKTAKTRKR